MYRLMRRPTSLIRTSERKILLNLALIIFALIFVNVKTLIMLLSFLEQARGRRTCSLRATWWIMLLLFLEQARGHHVGDPCVKGSESVSEILERSELDILPPTPQPWGRKGSKS